MDSFLAALCALTPLILLFLVIAGALIGSLPSSGDEDSFIDRTRDQGIPPPWIR